MSHQNLVAARSIEWAASLCLYEKKLKSLGRSKQTIETYLTILGKISRNFPSPLIEPKKWIDWTASNNWKIKTRQSYALIIESFCRFLSIPSPTDKLDRIRNPSPNPRPIPDELLIKAIEQADARTKLILLLAAEAGLRRAEIARLKKQDLFNKCLIIKGKGEKTRKIPITNSLEQKINNRPEGYIFPSKRNQHLSPETIGALAARYIPKPYTLHKLRHRYASITYLKSGNILAVQKLLGHDSPATTQLYIAVPEQTLTEVALAAELKI